MKQTSFSETYLRRPRLERELDAMLRFPLTVIQAPMGFGKSTLIREYMNRKRLEPLWVSLSASQGSVLYFWERLTSQLKRRNQALGRQLSALGFPMDIAQMTKIVGLLCDLPYPTPVFVVLDDYQMLDSPHMAHFVEAIISETVRNLHIVLITRGLESLPVSDLTAKGLCFFLTQDSLRFRLREISEYFSFIGLSVPEETVRQIQKQTDGWITGIYLISQNLKKGLPGLSSEPLNVLLAKHFYTPYSPQVRRLLEDCSFFDAFSAGQMAAVSKNPQAPDILRSLASSNALISYQASSGDYQIADSLRDFLQEKAHSSGRDIVPLYQRAAKWFLAHGRRFSAYHYFYLAREYEAILQDLNTEESLDIDFNQYHFIKQAFQTIMPGRELSYPLAVLRYMRASVLWSSDVAAARTYIEKTLTEMEKFFQSSSLPERQRSRILGEIHNTWIFSAFNRPKEMIDHARKAVSCFDGRYSCVVSNQTEFTYGAPSMIYSYYTSPGSLKATVDYIASHYHILEQAVEGCGHGCQSLIKGEFALETGDLAQAELMARRAIYESRIYRQISIEICAVFALARLSLLKGAPQKAAMLMTQLLERPELADQLILNTTAQMCCAYINALTGCASQIPSWLRSSTMDQARLIFDGLAFNYVITGRLLMMEGNYIQLDILCGECSSRFAVYSNQMGYIFNHIYRAVAKLHLYGRQEGVEELKKALAIAGQDQVFLPFIENVSYIQELLPDAIHSGVCPTPYGERLLCLCSRLRDSVFSVSFTEREKEVLALLAQGLKHEEMAGKLCISLPTVRYHIQNIYKKLGVNNRTNALTYARQAGALERGEWEKL